VLVVDDEDEVRRNLGRFLAKKGLKTYCSASGGGAIETYEKYHIDFVLLDVMLPDMDGLEVLRKIKEKDPQPKVFSLQGWTGGRLGRKRKNSAPRPLCKTNVA